MASGLRLGLMVGLVQTWRLVGAMDRWSLDSQLLVLGATVLLTAAMFTVAAAVLAVLPGMRAGDERGLWVGWPVLAGHVLLEWWALGRAGQWSDLVGLLLCIALLGAAGARWGVWRRFERRASTWGGLLLLVGVFLVAVFNELPAASHGFGLPTVAVVVGLAALCTLTYPGRGRRRSLRLVLMIAVPLSVWQVSHVMRGPESEELVGAAAPRPPVIWISVDTLRADHLGCYGHPFVQTPTLDALADRGARFEEAISPYPLTNPSHATMMTGLHPGRHGLVLNGPMAFRPEVHTLPERLAEEGYRTAAFVAGYPLKRRMSALAPRFQLYDDDFSPLPWLPEAFFRNGLPRLLLQRLRGKDVRAGGHERAADEVLPRAQEWLRRNAEQPAFLFVHLYDPHGPYDPPAPYDRRYDPDYTGSARGDWYRLSSEQKAALIGREQDVQHLRARYAGEVSWVDAQLRGLFDTLDELGLRDQALVIFTSDHGESLGEHEYWFDHGHRLYDPSLHVPLILDLPGDADAGRVIPGMVSTMDLAPTVLDLLGLLPRPPGGSEPAGGGPGEDQRGGSAGAMDGRSLLEAIRRGDARGGEPVVSTLFRSRPGAVPRLEALSLRTEQRKLISLAEDEARLLLPETTELYDLQADPGETQDLSAERPQEVEAGAEVLLPRAQAWILGETFDAGALGEDDRRALEALGYLDAKEGAGQGDGG